MITTVIAAAVSALGVASGAGAQTIAVTGGTVYPVSSAPIQNGTVLIRNGKIVAVGADVAIPPDAQRVDATGKIVTPGFVDASTQLGVVEIGAVASTRDVSAADSNKIAAAFRVWDGLNSESVGWAPARNEGVTSVVVAPAGGLIAGQAALVDLENGRARDMVARAPVAMIAQVNDPGAAGTGARGELLSMFRSLLENTRFYKEHRADYDRGASRRITASRADLDAMIPVIEGRLPVYVNADRADDIEGALSLAKEFGMKIMIVGGAEAWMVADDLAAAHVPVLTGAMLNIPDSFQTLNQRQENLGILSKAGVPVAIVGNGADPTMFNVRNVRVDAGNAVAYGMSHDAALRALTLTPAEMLGASDRIGSLRPGRDANVVVWSGDPFEFSSHAEHVLIHGKEILAPSRQDMLTKRYRTLPPDYMGTP
jgi:imidazolonepropionase-like amidohydrolase